MGLFKYAALLDWRKLMRLRRILIGSSGFELGTVVQRIAEGELMDTDAICEWTWAKGMLYNATGDHMMNIPQYSCRKGYSDWTCTATTLDGCGVIVGSKAAHLIM